jgi:hypothetical protein
VRAFKAARLCWLVQVQSLDPTAESLEEFGNFPFINDDTKIANLYTLESKQNLKYSTASKC